MSSPVATFVKDPAATQDFAVDWTLVLPSGDTITASTWTADEGVTIGGDAIVGLVCKVFVAGGELGRRYAIVNRIETEGGRVDERTIEVAIEDR